MNEPILIEGYASIFGEADLAGDIVRAGAFSRSISGVNENVPMLLQHKGGKVAGYWTRIREDGKGLYMRGLIDPTLPAGKMAAKLMANKLLDGLSIGFIAGDWKPAGAYGRVLSKVDLREVSLVTTPMAPKARFCVVGAVGQLAA
ncbi:HK97 family phage prohead protease [Hirschia litorea]|uniref:HK97 family phage prohead protease n=1 Tax=Hirschia litorea TaxID=1199156 RepID=A0ABW2IJ77_9PROT